MPKDSVKPVALQTIDTSTLDAVLWTAIDAGGIEGPCFYTRITNTCGNVLFVSYDGVTAHDVLLSNDCIDINLQINSRSGNHVAQLPKGTVVYLRGTPAIGFAYLSGWYQVS